MMRSLLLLVVLACGGKQDASPQPISNVRTPPAPTAREQKFLAKMSGFRDALCKCADGDSDCAFRVNDEMTQWGRSDSLAQQRLGEPARSEAKRIGDEMYLCMAGAMGPRDDAP
jgi:hypothetical protein